jgi:hypothetical protein
MIGFRESIFVTNVNPVHNAPHVSVIGPDVRADWARRGGWGRERSVIDRPGLALPDFDLTRPGTPGFRSDLARHSRISTDRARRGGWGRERSVTDKPGPIFHPLLHRPLPSPTPQNLRHRHKDLLN